jgi:hypothetical protein
MCASTIAQRPVNRANSNDQLGRREDDDSPQQAPWHVGRRKIGTRRRGAKAYADALAAGTIDPERGDVFSKIRKDFDSAGVVQSDEQILRVMNELILQAADQMRATGGGASDAAAVMLARKLTSR